MGRDKSPIHDTPIEGCQSALVLAIYVATRIWLSPHSPKLATPGGKLLSHPSSIPPGPAPQLQLEARGVRGTREKARQENANRHDC